MPRLAAQRTSNRRPRDPFRMIPFLPISSEGISRRGATIRGAAYILWMLAIYAFSTMPGVVRSQLDTYTSDKTVHFAAFFIAAFLLHRWMITWHWPAAGAHGVRAALTVLIVSAGAAIDEVYQTFIPGRVGDVADWVADTSGALGLVALVAVNLLLVRRRERPDGERLQPLSNKIVAPTLGGASE